MYSSITWKKNQKDVFPSASCPEGSIVAFTLDELNALITKKEDNARRRNEYKLTVRLT